jgi:hypothetical protein
MKTWPRAVHSLLAVALAGSALAGTGQGAARDPRYPKSCDIVTAEGGKALDEIHGARDGSLNRSKRVVKTLLPRITKMLASDQGAPNEWLHVAVDLGKELARHERFEEARTLLARVAEIDSGREWGTKAADQLKELPPKP